MVGSTPSARSRHLQAVGLFAVLSMFATWNIAAAQSAKAPDYAAIIAAPDRSDADRQTDVRRDPAKLLAFTGAKPGMKVLDMGAGAGYSTELVARAVAPNGVVYAQDAGQYAERATEKFEARA